MDKIKIKFMNNQTKWKYQLRIPQDFNWFEICRYYKTEEKEFYCYIRIHEKVMFDCFIMIGNDKHKKILMRESEIEILKETAVDCINFLGYNNFTLEILDRMGFDIKYLKRKYLKKLPKINKNYTLLPKKNDDKYDYDILEDNNVLGRCYLNEGILNLLVYPDCSIDVEQLQNYKLHDDAKIESKMKRYLKFK